MAVTLDSLKKAVKKNKGRSQALAWLADMERAAGNFDDALKLVDEALVASPSDVPAMLVRAKILVAMQDFAGSITEYKKVLSKDPFCLSAHKRMGESYDKLGKEPERNACFRRVHDMDPLDPFWKDEYDVLPEEQSDLVAPPMDDSSFTMDVDETDVAGADSDVFANLAASLPNTDEEDNTAMDALRSSLATATGENAEQVAEGQDASYDGHMLNTSEVSSAISDILGGDDDLDAADFDEENAEPETNDSPFSHMEFSKAVDDAALESIDAPVEDAPAEESAGGLFEKSADAEFSMNDSEKVNDEDATNIDDVFSSLLGDDELPEEQTEERAAEVPEDVSEDKVSSDEPAPEVSDDSLSLDEPSLDATEDNLSLEEPSLDAVEEKAPEAVETSESSESLESLELPSDESLDSAGSLFEKSADAEFSLNDSGSDIPSLEESTEVADKVDETEIEQTEQTNEAPAEDLSLAASDSSVPSDHMDFSDAEDLSLTDDSELSLDGDEKLTLDVPASSGVIPSTHMDFSDAEDILKEEDVLLDVSPAEETPAETENSEKKGISEDLSVSVDSAFDDLFGDEEQTPAAATAAETAADTATEEAPAETKPLEEPAAEAPTTEETVVEEQPKAEAKEEDLAKEMGGAFASMFGDEDELSLSEEKSETPAEEPLSQEATSAEIEENIVADAPPAETVELEEPALEPAKDSDDDFVLESATDFIARESSEQAAANSIEKTAEEAPVEKSAEVPSAELDSLGSEVSNAFKGLFDEEDSEPEADAPSNKGVDYLMSGDSDDEVSASLVDNAAAPLSRGAADLDDSLNTRTLADIYMEQGVYNKALEIYSDLAKKNPNDPEIKSRLDEVQKLCREKFGEN